MKIAANYLIWNCDWAAIIAFVSDIKYISQWRT